MRKGALSILIFSLLMTVSVSCTGQETVPNNTVTTVPESLVQIVISKDIEDLGDKDCTNIKTDIMHNTDKDAHSDTVTVYYVFSYQYGYYKTVREALIYQYDAGGDKWDKISGGKLQNVTLKWNTDQFDHFIDSSYTVMDYYHPIDLTKVEESGLHVYVREIDWSNGRIRISGEYYWSKHDSFTFGNAETETRSEQFDDWYDLEENTENNRKMYSVYLELSDGYGIPDFFSITPEEGLRCRY